MRGENRTLGYRQGKGAFYKVFHEISNNIRMTFEAMHALFWILAALWLFVFVVLSLLFIGFRDIKLLGMYFISLLMTTMGAGSGTVPLAGGYTAAKVVSVMQNSAGVLTLKLLSIALISSAVFLLTIPAIKFIRKKGEESKEDIWLDGARYSTEDEVNQMMERDNKRVDIKIGRIGIPFDYETQHGLIYGQTGTGKTVIIAPLIETILERGDRFAAHDTKGDFVSKLHDPERTLIFNPLDDRHMKPFGGWSVFNEISTMMDIYTVANSIVPKGTGREVFFNSGAQDILAGLLFHCYFTGKKSNKDVWNVLSLPALDQSIILKSTKGGERGYGYLANPDTPMAQSVRAVMLQFCKCFEYMVSSDGKFCIGDWVKNEKQQYRGIFVSNYQQIAETLRPVLSLFFDILAIRLLAQEDDDTRQKRLFMILDEMNSLQQLSSLIPFVTLSRSKSGSMLGSFQTVSQIEKNYGKEDCDTIIDNCKITVTLRVGSPNTAEFLSKKIGDVKKVKTNTSTVMKTGSEGEGVTVSEAEVTERLVMPSTIQNLPDLTCYVHMPGYNVTKTTLIPKSFPKKNEPFVMRPGLSLDEIQAAQEQLLKESGSLKTLVQSQLDKDVNKMTGKGEDEVSQDAQSEHMVKDDGDLGARQAVILDDDILNMYR